ncbi:MAG: glycosyltransferase [Nitrospiraceae bacterium]|nr:MAG: glycosyltransferase [Nitrospiraceae bacterium]
MINLYTGIVPNRDLQLINKLCEKLKGKSFLHVNSTREGGGVSEILQRMIPLLKAFEIDAQWSIIKGDAKFFDITKKFHNALQGNFEHIPDEMWQYHYDVTMQNVEMMDFDTDAVFIHDPQPVPLVECRKGNKSSFWVWRCHIDISNPVPEIWDRMKQYVERYQTSIFSVARFSRALSIDELFVTPSIDPLSDKNRELTQKEIDDVIEKYKIPLDKPVILQVSRFDRFKDPIGVIKVYRMVKKYTDCQLILAGSPATDDPEGEAVLNEVREFAGDDPDIHILLLPPFSDREINALQRIASVVLQKSLKEGFGLTVSEAMWKEKPVIGGAVGGIPLQIVHGITGFLVYSVEGAAFRVRQFLNNPDMAKRMGQKGKEYVRDNFLITRQIRDYLSIWYALGCQKKRVIEL